jgi:hypothetical protein
MTGEPDFERQSQASLSNATQADHFSAPKSGCIMIDIPLSPRDEFSELIRDVCAVVERIILLAPPDQQRDICVLALREINDIVEQVLYVNNTTPPH